MATKSKKTPNVHRVSLMGTASMLDIIIQEQIAVARKHQDSRSLETLRLLSLRIGAIEAGLAGDERLEALLREMSKGSHMGIASSEVKPEGKFLVS